MLVAQAALFYRTGLNDKPALVFEASTTTYSTTQVQAQNGGNSLMAPRLLWENGRTHYVFQDVTTTTGGRHFILTYDDRYGISRPIGFGATAIDTHHRPAIIKHNNKLYIIAENNHNTDPIRIWASEVDDEAMILDLSATTIGATPTYPNVFNKNGVFTVLNQGNDINAKYSKNSSGNFEGTWTTEDQISQRQADEDEHYVGSPSNGDALPNEVVFLIGGRNDDTSPATWFNKYIIRAEVTAGGITYYNWRKTFNTSSLISAANMAAEYRYYTTGSDTAQAYAPVTAQDNQGNFYDVTGDGSGGYDFVYLITGQSTPTEKAISLPGSPTILDGADIGLDGQNGGCVFVLAVSPLEIYAFFRIDEGGFGHIYMYKTVDLGDNWTFVVDVFDDINADIYGFTIAYNAPHIPNNRNFICVGTGTGAPLSNIYMKRMAWGEIQADNNNFYDDYTAYSAAEYDALMLRSYYVEAGKVTNTGTTLNTLIDQSASAQNATAVATPVLDSSTTPTFVTFNGTNNAMQIPTTGLLALQEGTVIVVAKPATGVSLNFVTFSRNGVSTPFQAYGKSAANFIRVNDTGVLTIEGSTSVTDAFHIFAYVMQNGRCAILEFLDGQLQFRTETLASASEGRFTLDMATTDRVQIARLVRNTTVYSAFAMKHVAISGTPLTTEQLARAMKYLANKYSITLTDHYSD